MHTCQGQGEGTEGGERPAAGHAGSLELQAATTVGMVEFGSACNSPAVRSGRRQAAPPAHVPISSARAESRRPRAPQTACTQVP